MLDGVSFSRDLDAVMKLRNVEQAEPPQEHRQGGRTRGRLFGLADQTQPTDDGAMLTAAGTHHDQDCSPHASGSLVGFVGSGFPRTYVVGNGKLARVPCG